MQLNQHILFALLHTTLSPINGKQIVTEKKTSQHELEYQKTYINLALQLGTEQNEVRQNEVCTFLPHLKQYEWTLKK